MSSSSSSKQSVLVTGASGFIGSHLVRRLLQLQHDVHVLARPNSDLSALPAGYTRHIGDVTDVESIIKACKQTSFDVIFHLAAHIGYTKAERSSMQRINVDGTRNILTAVKQCKVRRLIYCSSVVAVGACETEPTDAELLNEDSEYNMTKYNLGYFETKREAELLALQFANDQNIDVVVLCPSNVYGRGDALKSSRKTQLQVARGQMKFYTFGGINIVDVDDVVTAFIAAWHKGRTGQRYIIGGENITVKQLLTLHAAAAGVRAPFLPLPTCLLMLAGHLGFLPLEKLKPAQMFLWFDCSKAQKELGIQPKPARQAIDESVAFMRENGMLNIAAKSRLFRNAAVVVAAGLLLYWMSH